MSKTKNAVIDDLNSQRLVICKYKRVIVSAEINGFGIDIEAEVSKITSVLGRTLVVVDYVNPIATPDGKRGGCYYIEQLKLKIINHE